MNENKELNKLAKNISEFKLKDNSNMSSMLLKENKDSMYLEKSRKMPDYLLKLRLLLKRQREKDKLNCTIKKCSEELKLRNLSKRDLELSTKKIKSAKESPENKELKNTDSNKKEEKPKDRLESRLKGKSMKKELNWKKWSVKRSLKNIAFNKRE